MTEKVKKKLFISLKRMNSKSDDAPASPSLETPKPATTPPVLMRMKSAADVKPRKLSIGGIKELVQCPLCLEVLHNPKMLSCQHTFCLACLSVHVGDAPVFACPICRTKIHVTSPSYISGLPSNLYIDSLLQLVVDEDKGSREQSERSQAQSVELFAGGAKCHHCKSLCDSGDVSACEHCRQSFCTICWAQHLDDMQRQVGSILKQLEAASDQLEHKIEGLKDRAEHLTEQISVTADEKVAAIMEAKEALLKETADMQRSEEMTALALKVSLAEAQSAAARAMLSDDKGLDKTKVSTFMNIHAIALSLLSDVSKWNTSRLVLDKQNFCIEKDCSTALEAESDDPEPLLDRHNNPLDSEESLVTFYRSKSFIPHYIWRKSTRPGGVALAPWSDQLYVCGLDSQCVMVVERTQAKIVARLSHESMLCPAHVAFCTVGQEVYVTDKWKHCVHVFTRAGDYARCVGSKGSRAGQFRSPEGVAVDQATRLLYVVDTGNDRVQVLQPDGKYVDTLGVTTQTAAAAAWAARGGGGGGGVSAACTELNAPTAVAVSGDRVVVLDSGNRRVKVYNKRDKSKMAEFGSLGQRKGQFRQPEVLAVDPLGFILVGDSGNSRVQVFRQNGQLVRVFGGLGTEPGKFGWITGIHVTKQLDIIISDTKNHCVNFI